MTNREKTKKLFNLILQYYILYTEASMTRDTYYEAYEAECEREISIKNMHIPSMSMSKQAFKVSATTTGFFSLVEFMISGNPPIMTLLIASLAYGLYVKNNIDQHNIELDHLAELKNRDDKYIKELRKIVYEISALSKELNYNVTLHTSWAPTEEELYHLKRYYQAELDRLYPSYQKIMKY